MIDNSQDIKPIQPPTKVLAQIQAIASEHFDDCLIVVSKGNERYFWFSTEDGANGKCNYILSKISKKWWGENEQVAK